MKPKTFPILNGLLLKAIPWSIIAPHEDWIKNHTDSSSLINFANEGRLTCYEILNILDYKEKPFWNDKGFTRKEQWEDYYVKQEMHLLGRMVEWLIANPIPLRG